MQDAPVKVTIRSSEATPSITVGQKKFHATSLKYQYAERGNGQKNFCTMIALGFIEGDPKKYGIVGNVSENKFTVMDYEAFVTLATSPDDDMVQ